MGVDGGGTRTRALALDLEGRELGEGEAEGALVDPRQPDAAADAIFAAMTRAAESAGVTLPATALCAGLAGGGREPERSRVGETLRRRQVAKSVQIVTDAEAAFFDAFGDGPGILVIAGTGSMAWGRGESGATLRVGGWGALLGDEGSGYDIGRNALQAAVRAADQRAPETRLLDAILGQLRVGAPEALIPWAARATKADIAALAPLACKVAQAGDPAALRILEEALQDLDRHVAALIRRLGPWSRPSEVAPAGGLIGRGGPLHNAFLRAIRHHGCTPVRAPVRPARGAARLALRAALETGGEEQPTA